MLQTLTSAQVFIGSAEIEVKPSLRRRFVVDIETSFIRFDFVDMSKGRIHKIHWTYFDAQANKNTTMSKDVTEAKWKQVKTACQQLYRAGLAKTTDFGRSWSVDTARLTEVLAQ